MLVKNQYSMTNTSEDMSKLNFLKKNYRQTEQQMDE